MFFNLLDDAAQTNTNNGWFTWVILAVFVVLVVVYFMFSGRKRGQAQKEYTEMLEAIKPGNKVKTAGGICGIVVEVCDDDNTVIIETGSEQSGKSYIKMDKELIAKTDAKGPTQIARERAEAERKAAKEAKKSGAAKEEAASAQEDPAAEEKPAAEEHASQETKEDK